jgi:hypothetical protein
MKVEKEARTAVCQKLPREADLIMLGFACGRTPNGYQQLFEHLLGRELTRDEEARLADLEGDAYSTIDHEIGPLEWTLDDIRKFNFIDPQLLRERRQVKMKAEKETPLQRAVRDAIVDLAWEALPITDPEVLHRVRLRMPSASREDILATIAAEKEMSPEMNVEEWLEIRKAEGKKIDPATAEVDWTYGVCGDPYGLRSHPPEEEYNVGRIRFARNPGSDVWVAFEDLPEEVREELYKRHGHKLAALGRQL